MIALSLAFKSLTRAPRPNIAAMIALVSVLVPAMLLWSMKVGFIQSMMDALRSSPASLEIRVKGDYIITSEQWSEITALDGVGFSIPTARYLSTRAFASRDNGRKRTPVSLMPTAVGDPLVRSGAGLLDSGHAVLSQKLSKQMGLSIGDHFEIANARRSQSEHLRIGLTVADITSKEGVSGNWVFVAPAIIKDVEAFLDGYALPHRGKNKGTSLDERPDVASGLRLYADRIESVVHLTEAMRQLGYTVESNANRIEVIARLDRVLSRIVVAISLVLMVGLVLSVWSWMVVQLERLRSHVALLGLMGQGQVGVGMYFVFIGLFNALGGLLIAGAITYLTMLLGNHQFRFYTLDQTDIFVLPAGHLAVINAVVLALQLLIACFIAFQSSKIRPGDLFRDA
ncbi:hypothetical protein [Cohaesibacter celericrescens]|uniref:hypothetical protein n=1 Tax=Cohaesibacter celericrescens TaxID=2067669 RepID=UPI00356A809D